MNQNPVTPSMYTIIHPDYREEKTDDVERIIAHFSSRSVLSEMFGDDNTVILNKYQDKCNPALYQKGIPHSLIDLYEQLESVHGQRIVSLTFRGDADEEYYRGHAVPLNGRIYVHAGTLRLRKVAIHEFAHLLAGPRAGHNGRFYEICFDLYRTYMDHAERIAAMAREFRYKSISQAYATMEEWNECTQEVVHYAAPKPRMRLQSNRRADVLGEIFS